MQSVDPAYPRPASPSPGMGLLTITMATGAIVVPTLIAANLPPSSTFFNQAAAVVGWGGLLVAAAPWCRLKPGSPDVGAWTLLAAIGILMMAALSSAAFNELPWSLAFSNAGMLLVAASVVLFGIGVGQGRQLETVFHAVCLAMVIAGVLGSVVGCLQVFAPDLPGNDWFAATSHAGRASGNLRQPNHLSSLLSWSIVACGWLMHRHEGRRWFWLLPAFVVLMVLAMALSASRTGWIAIAMIAGWAAFDVRLSRRVRIVLGLTPVVYVLCWAGLTAWAHASHQVFGGEARLTAEGDISSSRFGIWSNTIALIAQHPLAGVGFGEFNFAWSLTPFPHRPVAFFDHTHNIALQFLVELGLPLGVLVLGLLGCTLVRAVVIALEAQGHHAATLAASTMSVLIIIVHSLLEYPLWYSYFLLPTAFFLGVVVSLSRAGRRADVVDHGAQLPGGSAVGGSFAVVGALVVVAGLATVVDYTRVTAIFASDSSVPLAVRIAKGQKSVFFAYQADYAADTTSTTPGTAMRGSRATYNLLDTRLMMAWAKAYAQRGDLARARYLAARLREFHNADSEEFFEVCSEPAPAGGELPFQCQPDVPGLGYKDFKVSGGG
jgi:O-antigen ligase